MKIRLLIFTLFICSGHFVISQKIYFQQKIDYKISARLNPDKKAIHGHVSLDYFNASPDTLRFIWFHIWPNAYANGNTALAKQIEKDKELKKSVKKAESGYMDSLDFSAYGKSLNTQPHPEHIDIIRVILNEPLLPGQSLTLETPFYNKLPTYFSRSGFSDGQFIATQWYPKPALYDNEGWHPMPYLDMGEYYSNFGNFDVSVTLPANMIMAASGILQDQEELAKYKEVGRTNNNRNNKKGQMITLPTVGTKTLHYVAENVHDFAWFAMPDAVVQYDTCILPSGRVIDVFSYYWPESRNHWINAIDYMKSGIRFFSHQLGEYPHPQVSAVQAPRNVNSGGMEYPMITLITVPPKEMGTQLEITIVHEVGHNWFQGILGTNERIYPWFDEGVNTFYQFLYEAQQGKNSVYGNKIPEEVRGLPPAEFFNVIMQSLAGIPFKYAVNTSSEDFDSKEQYGLTAYFKGAIWVFILQSRMGVEKFEKGMRSYYETWKFRHPSPADFRAIMEQAAGYSLEDIFSLLEKEGNFI
jgi:hypothetical protein